MTKSMRQPTLETLGLGNVIDIFKNGRLPVNVDDLVDKVFGDKDNRGALVISGANGIVGAGKLMQLGVRLQPYGIPIIGLDMAGAPDGIGMQYQGLEASFGREKASEIMSNVIQLTYDGKHIPGSLKKFNPKVLIEAIPEFLELKKSHFAMFREAFPGIEIRSVTSGFPKSELGAGIAHPAFPHQINKIWEIVEDEPSDVTKLLWALGLIPIPVSDDWSFVLDVIFCGLTLAAIRYHEATNMPFWKIDKYVRKYVGPNPFRAHDVIGAKGANFLTWSCLYHLGQHYGDLFKPADSLDEHKESGSNWYPLNHLRPMVNWTLEDEDIDEFDAWVFGPVIQMTSIMLKEERAHFAHMNSIGELCAQFRQGVLAVIRNFGKEKAVGIVENYHKLHPEAAKSAWYPEMFDGLDGNEWNQLYINAEHDGDIGVITIGRESYNHDVNAELNRAIDWLKAENIENVILTGDFHLTTQHVGADTSDFFPAMEDASKGFDVAYSWSQTARRLNDEFKTSVGFINGKRCLGGMLELMTHCHYLVSVDDASLGTPEVTLPVVPGMEFCHWPFRKTANAGWQNLLKLLLEGNPVKAKKAVGWLVDFAGSMDDSVKTVWAIASGRSSINKRQLNDSAFTGIPETINGLYQTDNPAIIEARKAILENVINSCNSSLEDAVKVQAEHSGNFMVNKHCQRGIVGTEYFKTMKV